MLLSELITHLKSLERSCGDMPVIIDIENRENKGNELYLNYTVGDMGPCLVVTNERDY